MHGTKSILLACVQDPLGACFPCKKKCTDWESIMGLENVAWMLSWPKPDRLLPTEQNGINGIPLRSSRILDVAALCANVLRCEWQEKTRGEDPFPREAKQRQSGNDFSLMPAVLLTCSCGVIYPPPLLADLAPIFAPDRNTSAIVGRKARMPLAAP
jgi:hypothetical protein